MSDNIKFIATVCSSVIGVSLGLFGIGYAIGSRKKMNAVNSMTLFPKQTVLFRKLQVGRTCLALEKALKLLVKP